MRAVQNFHAFAQASRVLAASDVNDRDVCDKIFNFYFTVPAAVQDPHEFIYVVDHERSVTPGLFSEKLAEFPQMCAEAKHIVNSSFLDLKAEDVPYVKSLIHRCQRAAL